MILLRHPKIAISFVVIAIIVAVGSVGNFGRSIVDRPGGANWVELSASSTGGHIIVHWFVHSQLMNFTSNSNEPEHAPVVHRYTLKPGEVAVFSIEAYGTVIGDVVTCHIRSDRENLAEDVGTTDQHRSGPDAACLTRAAGV